MLNRDDLDAIISAKTICAVPVVLAFDPQSIAPIGLIASLNLLQCHAHGRAAVGASLPPIPKG
jgi:hydrogenase/urease accessory protein HupE